MFKPSLTLKRQTKIAADDILIILLLSFEENKAWFFHVNPLETSSLIFSKNKEKICMNVACCSRDWRFEG